MYQSDRYKNNHPEFIYDFIKAHPFAALVLQGEELLATHVPVLVKGSADSFKLFAHIANHNPMREFLSDQNDMLLIFSGADSYISSSWYAETDIPTWDYTAVHVNAKVKLQTREELQLSLEILIERFERGSKNPVSSRDIPKDMWDENFNEITGFWLEPFKMVGIEKLHQGFSEKDIINITENLNSRPGCPMDELAFLMKEKHNLGD